MVSNERNFIDILNNMDKIILRGMSDEQIEDVREDLNFVKENGFDFVKYMNKILFISNLLIYGIVGSLLLYLIRLVIHKKIDYTLFITLFTIIIIFRDRLTWCFQQLPDYIEAFTKDIDLINNMNYKDYEEIINGKEKQKEKLEFNTVSFQNIYFNYDKNKVFNNYNLELNINNKIIGVIGYSGVGKSTFAKLLLKIYDYKGIIKIDGIDIQNIDGDYIRKNIIYINQNSRLFDLSVYDNLLYGSKNKKKSRAYFNEVFQFEKIKKMLENIDIDANVGLNGEKLSGGQRQIINIINGLICDSPILILDEPTNALDNELKNDIIHLIKYFKKYKKCIIIITHDKDIFKIFDEKIHFEKKEK
jgi:ATP-binding cassette subfamily B protein